MNNLVILALCLMVGILLGLFFFGGLWWTMQRGMVSKNPAIWFLGSIIFRMLVTLVGFYYIGHGSWQRMLSCLVGFSIARVAGLRVGSKPSEAHES
jgi:F1F0 ATPase subunit 2